MNPIIADAEQALTPPVYAPRDSRNSFSVERVDGAQVVNLAFARHERVKVAGTFPMTIGVISGISHASRQVKVNGVWFDFGYIYKVTYDERAAPRASIRDNIRTLEDRLDDGNTIDAQGLLDQIHNEIQRYQLHEAEPDLARLRTKLLELVVARRAKEAAEKADRQVIADQRKRDGERAAKRLPKKLIRMTMEEWKKVHRDFKGKLPDGTRSVIHHGGLIPVEIVKDLAKSSHGQAIDVSIGEA